MEVSQGGGETLEDDDDGGLFGQKRKREGKGSGGRIKTESDGEKSGMPSHLNLGRRGWRREFRVWGRAFRGMQVRRPNPRWVLFFEFCCFFFFLV
ncbi:hypothetical protein EUGRSUZ_B00982 [Eucalyptus grandis]|uniref:Uncharacterized protein n=2 Tax=Eucalyptus grandis TaxID=71139 RepID=A0ACC3LP94_EUCGR|nr:hypothetical protein EUGRSUZ_B00982 [Eucalyptus grandis]